MDLVAAESTIACQEGKYKYLSPTIEIARSEWVKFIFQLQRMCILDEHSRSWHP